MDDDGGFGAFSQAPSFMNNAAMDGPPLDDDLPLSPPVNDTGSFGIGAVNAQTNKALNPFSNFSGASPTNNDATKIDETDLFAPPSTTTSSNDGGFGAFTSNTPVNDGGFGAFATTEPPSNDVATLVDNFDMSFAAMTMDESPSTMGGGLDDFASFASAPKVEEEKKPEATEPPSNDGGFGDFGSFPSTMSTDTSSGGGFGDFAAFSSSTITDIQTSTANDNSTTSSNHGGFGSFAAFESSSTPSTSNTSSGGGFGDFAASSSTNVASMGGNDGGFGAFDSAPQPNPPTSAPQPTSSEAAAVVAAQLLKVFPAEVNVVAPPTAIDSGATPFAKRLWTGVEGVKTRPSKPWKGSEGERNLASNLNVDLNLITPRVNTAWEKPTAVASMSSDILMPTSVTPNVVLTPTILAPTQVMAPTTTIPPATTMSTTAVKSKPTPTNLPVPTTTALPITTDSSIGSGSVDLDLSGMFGPSSDSVNSAVSPTLLSMDLLNLGSPIAKEEPISDGGMAFITEAFSAEKEISPAAKAIVDDLPDFTFLLSTILL